AGFVYPGSETVIDVFGRRMAVDSDWIVIDDGRPVETPLTQQLAVGFGVGHALRMAGRVVLHGPLLVIGDAVTAFVGESDAGKSTVASRLYDRGHPVVSEPFVPVGEDGRVPRGPSCLRLPPERAAAVTRETTPVTECGLDKCYYALEPASPVSPPYRLDRVYLFESNDGAFGIDPVTDEPGAALWPYVFGRASLRHAGRAAAARRRLDRACADCSVRRVRNPKRVEPSDVAAAILADR
ncbi:MAG: hypothetical protein ABEI99_05905, partial [Halobaculum sp.]